MTISIALTTVFLMTGLPIDAATLDGQRLSGELLSLSSTEAVMLVDGESRAVPVSKLQELRLQPSAAAADTVFVRSDVALRLRDGSVLTPTSITAARQQFALISDKLGDIAIPKRLVSSLRLAPLDNKIAAAWQALLGRDNRDDIVVIRKGDALDHVAGVVGTINEKSVSLLFDGRSIDLPRNRVFGVVYATTNVTAVSPFCRFDLSDGQQLSASSVQFDADTFQVKLTFGSTLNIDPADVQRIDFSLGKIRFLAEMEPTSVDYPVDHSLYLAEVWRYRRDRNSRGEPLLLGGRNYDNGLWIHSGTVLRFRLGREYRRLRSLIGIDEDLGDCSPRVGLVIRGDGRVLHEEEITRGDDVRVLDIDVEGIRELEIEVTSTDPDGICEHLDLVEARLIK